MLSKDIIRTFSFLFIFAGLGNPAKAQHSDTISKQFLMNIEIRPRAEYTSNYILPPNDSIDP
ncbi:hypothetical protein HYN56_15655 [Flavobacterium crocinum]|uniref:Uncharacterized protein n=1 Tax=Flavobacterium crocinum TaxID=2183896 RepID=A0A2S1YNH3_9FLAO|nr:hypothetical protein [Flavobacterium crocinum]AWK05593.1 hypothetical protein HYN56_15655 [Flavobacterium crocinum]